MKTPRTKRELECDPRLLSFERTHAPESPWIALTKYPYLFEGNSRSEQGTIKEICDSMKFLEESPENFYE